MEFVIFCGDFFEAVQTVARYFLTSRTQHKLLKYAVNSKNENYYSLWKEASEAFNYTEGYLRLSWVESELSFIDFTYGHAIYVAN